MDLCIGWKNNKNLKYNPNQPLLLNILEGNRFFSYNIMVLLSFATGCWNFYLYHLILCTIALESWFRLIILVIPVTSFGDLQIDRLSHLIISIEWRSIKTYASRDCRCGQFICDEIVAMKPHWKVHTGNQKWESKNAHIIIWHSCNDTTSACVI